VNLTAKILGLLNKLVDKIKYLSSIFIDNICMNVLKRKINIDAI